VRISADELKDRKTAASGDGASGDATSEPAVLRETQA